MPMTTSANDTAPALTPSGIAKRLRRGASSVRYSWLVSAACCSAVALCLTAQAGARSDELARNAGEAMLTYAAGGHLDPTRRIRLNGAELHVLSGSTRDDVHALLDVFGARCVHGRGVVGGFGEHLGTRAQRALESIAGFGGMRLDGVLRNDDDTRGYLACFDFGGAAPPITELVTRLRAFAASGDLSAIGDLRFVWGQREHAQTAYVALWSEGPLPLR